MPIHPTTDPRSALAREQLALIATLLGLALAGWIFTDQRMAGMDDGPGTDLGALGFFVSVWAVMMAAMMLPSISPMVAVYAHLQRARRETGRTAPRGATAVFVAGYVFAWVAAGLVAYGVFDALRSASFDWFAWDEGGRYLAGTSIVLAAAYQLTPLKHACLRRCRAPLGFVIGHWRDGYSGALRLGILHGAWCIGCCWALMLALFSLGVMSVGWMAFIAALIAVEKLVPWPRLAMRGVAVVLLALGVLVAAGPGGVPGLTVPGSHEMSGAMDR